MEIHLGDKLKKKLLLQLEMLFLELICKSKYGLRETKYLLSQKVQYLSSRASSSGLGRQWYRQMVCHS